MTPKPDLTVVVCTYNRCQSLNDAIDDLLRQDTQGEFNYDLIIVDNNSDDATKATVAALTDKHPGHLSYAFEPRQGKGFALNTGIKLAEGKIIVTTDDDCSFKNDYLYRIYKNFQHNPDDVVLIGGKIFPQWMKGQDSGWLDKIFAQSPYKSDGTINWIKVNFEGPLGILDYGDKPILIDWKDPKHDTRRFYGANMAFKKSVFEDIGYFKTAKIATEDTDICDRIFRAGFKGLYAPDVQLSHKIYRDHYDLGFFYSYFFRRGILMDPRELFPRKFYHPLGIQSYFFIDAWRFMLMSLNPKFDLFERAFYRCRAVFNLGQMLHIAQKNLI